MGDLTTRDLRAVLQTVGLIDDLLDDGEAVPGPDLPPAVLARLAQLAHSDSVSFCRVDTTGRRLLSTDVVERRFDLSRAPSFGDHLTGHPAFARYRRGAFPVSQPVALTDLASTAELRRLPLYTEVYRPNDVADQLLSVVRDDARQGALLVIRRSRRGFSRRDRAATALVTPYLAAALRRRTRRAALSAGLRAVVRNEGTVADAAVRFGDLTRREREVVECVATGSTDREAARALGISPRTVHKHLEACYRKLGVASRTAMVAALRRGDNPGEPSAPGPDRHARV